MDDIVQKTIFDKTNEPWWKESERKVLETYGQLFNPTNIDNLTKEDFKSFLLIKNNHHWEGIHRQGNLITIDIGALKRFLKFLLDENIPIKDRLRRTLDKGGDLSIKGLGKAVATPILLVVYPTKYGVWNARSEQALKKLNLFPDFRAKDTFSDKYLKVNNVLLELANKYNISLWQLDGIFGEISGNGPFEKSTSEEEKVEEEAQEHGVVDLVNFGMEKHLEDFLIANWQKTIFGKQYNLIFDEGDLISQQYQTSVGPIDILALSKEGGKYLVIELKKGRSSDMVVGQLLRYMAWVREHVAQGKTIFGAIIVLEIDEKLKYAIKELKNVTLYTYQVKFNLNPLSL